MKTSGSQRENKRLYAVPVKGHEFTQTNKIVRFYCTYEFVEF